jgi:NAD(P)-dependent dehydrogenase (short-subunit alcohol dehydrogenase family)
MSAYAASKAAVLNLTRSLAKELVEDRITVNAVLPSVIDTPDNRESMPDADTSSWLDPRDIARVIRWLVGEDAGIVTGAAVTLSLG